MKRRWREGDTGYIVDSPASRGTVTGFKGTKVEIIDPQYGHDVMLVQLLELPGRIGQRQVLAIDVIPEQEQLL